MQKLSDLVASKDALLTEWQNCHTSWVQLLQGREEAVKHAQAETEQAKTQKEEVERKAREELEQAKKEGKVALQKAIEEGEAKHAKTLKDLELMTEKVQDMMAQSMPPKSVVGTLEPSSANLN